MFSIDFDLYSIDLHIAELLEIYLQDIQSKVLCDCDPVWSERLL